MSQTISKSTVTKNYSSAILTVACREQLELLQDFINRKLSVQKELKCGIIEIGDATNELAMIETKERKLIKQLALQAHVKEDGTPRKIKYIESKGLYSTLMPDKTPITAKTEDKLYVKLCEAYGLSISDYSFEGFFNAALEEKSKTDNNNESTISHYKFDYNRFISKDLAKMDIRKITTILLKEYTQKLVNDLHPKKKAFYKYKGVLNLVFDYALEHNIIATNPVAGVKNSLYYKSCDNTPDKPENKILSSDEIQLVIATVRKYMKRKRYNGYFINGYAILFSIETGMRAGELPSLKWSDITDGCIHIHTQQLHRIKEGTKGSHDYYFADWTKNEKGVSKGGRKFPLTQKIKDILDELKALQASLGIQSEYVFCHENGEWIKTDAYETCLRRMLSSLGFSVTNNHAFRMSLNSNVFIGRLNMVVTERARLLGHSVETNLKNYSFAGKDNMDELCSILDGDLKNEVSPRSHLNVIDFEQRKSLRTTNSQAFQ